MDMQTFTQLGKSMWEEQDAVTSIEYALLGSLIAVVIVGAVGLVGQNTLGLWMVVQQCVSFAVNQDGSCQ